MPSRVASKQINLEWIVGEFVVDANNDGGSLTPDITLAVSSTVRVTRIPRRRSSALSTINEPSVLLPRSVQPRHQSGTIQGELRLILDLARWLLIAALGLLLISGASLSPSAAERVAIQRLVQRSLVTEDSAWRGGSIEQFANLLDTNVPDSWYRSWLKSWQVGQIHAESRSFIEDSQIHSLYLHDGIAVVNVQRDRPPDNPWQLTPVIETRFYRHPESHADPNINLTDGNGTWLRTAPNPGFWGQELALETAHLRFDYYARDAEIIEAAAPQLEAIYVELFRILGGPEPATDPKLKLVFVQSVETKWEAPGYMVEMMSPTLMERPLTLTQTEAFIDTVFTRLSFRVLAQAIPDTRRYWDSVGVGIRTWLRTQVTEIPSPWHDQTDGLFYDTLRKNQPLSALDVDYDRRANLAMNDTLVWQYRVAQSMIEYSVSTYGVEIVPQLLEGFARYRRWGDLIPYVYGLSPEEWEADWNSYLRRDLKLYDEADSLARSDPPQEGRPTR